MNTIDLTLDNMSYSQLDSHGAHGAVATFADSLYIAQKSESIFAKSAADSDYR
jgi:hypothetical protein